MISAVAGGAQTRRVVLALLVLHYANTYMDRVVLAAVAPLVMAEFGLDRTAMGVIFTAFSVPYALTQIPAGRLADRFGPRRVLTVIVTGWSLFTMAMVICWDRLSLAVCRFLFGAAQGGAFPVASRAVIQWFSPHQRGFVQGVTHTGARLAGAATPPLAVLLAAWGGWRFPFLVLGGLGLVWTWFWYRKFRDCPQEHRGLGPAPGAGSSRQRNLAWRQLLRDRNVWALNAMYFCYVYSFWIYITWFPSYLAESRGHSLQMAGVLASAPLLAGAAANTLGGMLSDRLSLRWGLRRGRRWVGIGGFLITALLIVPAALHEDVWLSLVLFTAAATALESTTGAAWAAAVDIGREDAGVVSGFMNTCGNLGGALSPLVFGLLVDLTGSWTVPFLATAGICVAGASLWSAVDPERVVGDGREFAKRPCDSV